MYEFLTCTICTISTCGKFDTCGYEKLKKTTRKRDRNGTSEALRRKREKMRRKWGRKWRKKSDPK